MKARELGIGGKQKIYKMSFSEPTTKLKIGSPIEFQNFQVGYITEIEDNYSKKKDTIQSSVYALLNIEAFTTEDLNSSQIEQTLPKLVQKGLKARLSKPIPVIGSQFIELIFDNSKEAMITKKNGYKILPTVTNQVEDDIMKQVKAVLAKLENLPLESLLNSANGLINENRKHISNLIKDLDKTVKEFNYTVKNMNKTVDNINRFTANEEFNKLPINLNQTLKELEYTLQTQSNDYSGDSQFADQLSITLKAVSEAAKSFDKTNKMLDRKANALVIGDE
jgi:paraquat-inducible protein B